MLPSVALDGAQGAKKSQSRDFCFADFSFCDFLDRKTIPIAKEILFLATTNNSDRTHVRAKNANGVNRMPQMEKTTKNKSQNLIERICTAHLSLPSTARSPRDICPMLTSSDYGAAGICRPLYVSGNGKAEARCSAAWASHCGSECGGLARSGDGDIALQRASHKGRRAAPAGHAVRQAWLSL